MTRIICTVVLMFLCACAGTPELTKEERSKIDPDIMKLLSGASVEEKEFDVGFRPNGVKEYDVIIRVSSTEELKALGINIQSSLGTIVTARLTLKELRAILKLPSVRSVEHGSKNYPH